MFRKYKYFLLILLLPIAGCTDDPTSFGNDLLNQDLIEVQEFSSAIDTINQSSSSKLLKSPVGISSRLFVGKLSNTEANSLLRFQYAFVDSIKNIINSNQFVVKDAWIELVPAVYTGTNDLNFTAHSISSLWTSENFGVNELNNLEYGENVISELSIRDSLTSFRLPSNLVTNWIKNGADNDSSSTDYGILLKPNPSSTKIYSYYSLSSTSSTTPRLKVYIEWSNGSDTLSFIPTEDVSIVNSSLPNLESSFAVQGTAELRGVLSFDVSKIPSNAIINRAELTLTLDTLNSVQGNYNNEFVLAYYIKEEGNDSLTNITGTLTKNKNVFKGDLSYIVQQWVSSRSNYGVFIASGNRESNADLLIFHGVTSTDVTKRPTLTITYTNKQ